jgi:hypothetical protein
MNAYTVKIQGFNPIVAEGADEHDAYQNARLKIEKLLGISLGNVELAYIALKKD